MMRDERFRYIKEKLDFLSFQIKQSGKINLLDLNIHCESFFADLLNLLYEYNLTNLNIIKQNCEAIDLLDKKNKIIAQVSSVCTRKKIEYSLEKQIIKEYSSYTFKFISISQNADKMRQISDFKNPHNIKFNPTDDIIDNKSILNSALHISCIQQTKLYDFIKKELGGDVSDINLTSNLAKVINILAKEDLQECNLDVCNKTFEIEKKIAYNDLNNKAIIKEYSIYNAKVDRIYSNFDTQGSNRSLSVLASIHNIYLKYKNKNNADDVFSSVISEVIDKVRNSTNFDPIPIEELELCVDILVVDAFIRCKIFEKPEANFNAST